MEISLWTAIAVLLALLGICGACYWYALRGFDQLLQERDAELRRQIVRAMRARGVRS